MWNRQALSARAAATAAALMLGLAACSTGTTASDAATSGTTTSVAASADTADGSSTTLTSGSYTATVGGTEVTYQAAYLVDGIDAVVDGGTYASAAADEVVFLVVNGGSLTVTGATITKAGDASDAGSDAYNFYGLNSAIVVLGDGSIATVEDTSITSDSDGSNAIVALDNGEVTVSSTSITTSADSSRGLHATYGGVITAADMSIDTAGAHSADVATDRGGGTVTVTGTNTFHTAGDGSPLVYSTGTIAVSGVTGTAEASEVVVVEGKNTANITDSDVTSGGGNALMIYQSMSGDAADSDAAHSVGAVSIENTTVTFEGTDAVLYFTNTSAELLLTGVTLDTSSSLLAAAQEDRWGTSGSNGADVAISVTDSSLIGDVEAGTSSSIDITTTSGGSVVGSTTGAVTISEG